MTEQEIKMFLIESVSVDAFVAANDLHSYTNLLRTLYTWVSTEVSTETTTKVSTKVVP